jgi:hypothetical protein
VRASVALSKPNILSKRALAETISLNRSVDKILHRWPDVVRVPLDNDRERLAQEMLRRINTWDWAGVKISRITSAALAVFDDDRRDRPDLISVRQFFTDEIKVRDPGTFLDSMAWVYIETFCTEARHTQSLAQALSKRIDSFGGRLTHLIGRLPNIFVPTEAARAVADIMEQTDSPYKELQSLGFRAPHACGLTQAAHRIFVDHIAPELKEKARREQLFNWLAPDRQNILQAGAGAAVEALLRHWTEQTPPDDVRDEISEAIIEAYEDPRLRHGGIWSGFDPELRAVLLRWLTKQDMKFFCDMVTATQNNHMWPPRRDFWLSLYEDGVIEEAWVAFGGSAREYARRHLLNSSQKNIDRRFGKQHDRGGSTSLLIMRIGNKIVVDGCHSYKTHIFRRDDRNAPKMYGSNYYCDKIMRTSQRSKAHNSIPNWKEWVIRHV